MSNPKGIDAVLRPVTGAIGDPGCGDSGLFGVAVVTGTAEHFDIRSVSIERAIGWIGSAAVMIKDGTSLPTMRVPAKDSRVTAVGIIRVQDKGDANLPGVTDAFGALRFGFGARKRRQKHCRQNGNDRNHHQQFDKRERKRRPDYPAFHDVKL